MTVTTEHRTAAANAVKEAIAGVSMMTAMEVQKWIAANTGFESLVDLVAASIAHGYTPTIRPVAESARAYREANMVADAYDAACTWAFGAGTGRCAYRGGTPKFTRKAV